MVLGIVSEQLWSRTWSHFSANSDLSLKSFQIGFRAFRANSKSFLIRFAVVSQPIWRSSEILFCFFSLRYLKNSRLFLRFSEILSPTRRVLNDPEMIITIQQQVKLKCKSFHFVGLFLFAGQTAIQLWRRKQKKLAGKKSIHILFFSLLFFLSLSGSNWKIRSEMGTSSFYSIFFLSKLCRIVWDVDDIQSRGNVFHIWVASGPEMLSFDTAQLK